MKSIFKPIIQITIILVFSVALIFSTLFITHHITIGKFLVDENKMSRYINDYSEIDHLNLDIKDIYNIGWLSLKNKKSSFAFFSSNPYGKFRIGIFGDSMTEGDETCFRCDIASYLQSEFEALGCKNIEVINFGSCGHGLSETYMVWDKIGEKLSLDLSIVGPGTFWPMRDRSFNIWKSPDTTHARFIIKNDELVLLSPVGANQGFKQIIENYFSFLTPLQYLKYDDTLPPPLLSPMMLAKGLTLENESYSFQQNPFYYYPNREEEIDKIYNGILKKMNNNIREPIAVININEQAIKIAQDVGIHSLHIPFDVEGSGLLKFPYLAPGGHFSAVGNSLVSNLYLQFILGKEEISFEYIKPNKFLFNQNTASFKQQLSPRKDVYILANNTPIALVNKKNLSKSFPWLLIHGSSSSNELRVQNSVLLTNLPKNMNSTQLKWIIDGKEYGTSTNMIANDFYTLNLNNTISRHYNDDDDVHFTGHLFLDEDFFERNNLPTFSDQCHLMWNDIIIAKCLPNDLVEPYENDRPYILSIQTDDFAPIDAISSIPVNYRSLQGIDKLSLGIETTNKNFATLDFLSMKINKKKLSSVNSNYNEKLANSCSQLKNIIFGDKNNAE